jgi:hypothetical protein
MPAAWFEPEIPARDRPQKHALDRAAIGVFKIIYCMFQIIHIPCSKLVQNIYTNKRTTIKLQ